MDKLSAVRRDVRWWVWGLFCLLLLACWLLDLLVGSVQIPLGVIFKIFRGIAVPEHNWGLIILDYRLPKSITAMLAGASLAVAGLQMQTLFHNPLADPFILGISSGANLGAALVILAVSGSGVHFLARLSFWGDIGIVASAALGAFLVFLLIVLLARRVHTTTLLILGVLLGYVVSALVRILVQNATPESVQAYLSWTYGSFSGVAWQQLIIFTPILLLSLSVSVLTIKPLNALLMGEVFARSVGIDPQRARWLIVLNTSILAGTVTAFCGIIGFIGIAVPHLCRSLLGTSDHRQVLPACVLMGGSIALLADLLSQSLGGMTMLPLNSVTALIGGPVIIFVILKKRNVSRVFDL